MYHKLTKNVCLEIILRGSVYHEVTKILVMLFIRL